MTVQMTAAQARKLGIDLTGAKAAKVKTTRRTVKGAPYLTICKTCGMEFRTVASEDRHVKEFKHARYEVVLGT